MNLLENTYNKIRNIKGATLTELLIVIAVMGIALVPVSQALMTGFETFVTENENMERVYDGHTALEIITDKIRFNGNDVSKKIEIKDVVFNNEPKETLVFENESIYLNDNGQIISSIDNIETILLENVKSMSFNNIEHNENTIPKRLSQFDITIVINKKDYGEQNFNTTIYLRNR